MVGVVGTGTGLRVVLNTKHRCLKQLQCSHGLVVEVVVGYPHSVGGQGFGHEGKTVVLAGDLHLARAAARVIKTSMAVAQFKSGASKGQPQDLVAKADAKKGEIGQGDKTFGELNSGANGGRIAGAIGQEHSLGLVTENLLQAGIGFCARVTGINHSPEESTVTLFMRNAKGTS